MPNFPQRKKKRVTFIQSSQTTQTNSYFTSHSTIKQALNLQVSYTPSNKNHTLRLGCCKEKFDLYICPLKRLTENAPYPLSCQIMIFPAIVI